MGSFQHSFKDEDGVGKLGGKKEVDLKRITKQIRIPYPLFSNNKSQKNISNGYK